jgi:hypothetical protein
MNTNTSEFWIQTNFTITEIDGKKVVFEFTTPDKFIPGIGTFRALQRPTGEMHIDIVVTTSASQYELIDRIFTLKQQMADLIQKHPDPSIAEFRLIA